MLGMGGGDGLYAEESSAGSGAPLWHRLDGKRYAGADAERTVFEHSAGHSGSRRQRVHCPDSGDCVRDAWENGG